MSERKVRHVVPIRPHGGGFDQIARYMMPIVSPTSEEPMLRGTMGADEPVYSGDLLAEPTEGNEDGHQDDQVGEYPLGEDTVFNIPINRALLDLEDYRVLANMWRLQMVGTKERALRQWEQHIKGLEEYILAK